MYPKIHKQDDYLFLFKKDTYTKNRLNIAFFPDIKGKKNMMVLYLKSFKEDL